MKIYIVTCGEYSDYCVLAAFLDKSKAEVFVQKYNHMVQQYDEAKIEEYEDGVPFDFETMNVYAIRFYYDGPHDIVKKELHDVRDFQKALPSVAVPRGNVYSSWAYLVTVAAKDEEHAFKIACDTLAKWKAEKEGL